ncbi:hypothetical protein ACVBEQ_13060 [Nakamurella sp. GG22]
MVTFNAAARAFLETGPLAHLVTLTWDGLSADALAAAGHHRPLSPDQDHRRRSVVGLNSAAELNWA